MKTDEELEQLVRATFSGRAQTITRGPAWSAGPALGGPAPQRRWMAVLAAAAAVAAIVASIAVVRDHTDEEPATSKTPSPTISHAVTPTHITQQVPRPSTTCATTLPQAWKSAVQNSTVDSGSPTPDTPNTQILGLSGANVIALRDDSPILGSGREVVLLRPGHAPKTLYSVPQPDRYNVHSADLSGKWLVIGIWQEGRSPKNTIGGNTPDVIAAIVALDTTTGHSHLVTSAASYLKSPSTKGLTIVDDAVVDGKVYWNERASYAATKGTVKSYDLSTRTVATVATDVDGQARVIAQPEGLVFDIQGEVTVLVASALPSVVRDALNDFGRAHLSSDGTSFAWAVDSSTVGFWRPGMAAATYARFAGGFDTDDSGGAPVVAGNYVITMPGGGPVLLTNMVTKASAKIPAADFPHGGGQFFYGSGGYFAGYAETGVTPHYVNGYWLDRTTVAVRLDTHSLPKLSC